MASRGETVSVDIATAMGASSYTVYGDKRREQRARAPRIAWTESDDPNRIRRPRQQEPDPTKHSCAERTVGFDVEIWGRTDEESENLLHSFLAALWKTLTARGFEEEQVIARGNRPASDGHVRELTIYLRFPVFDHELELGSLDTTTANGFVDVPGDDPEPSD